MRTLTQKAVLLAAFVVAPLTANAASLIANTQNTLGSTCDSATAPSGSVSASCGSFLSGDGIDARASFGDLGLRSQVSGPSTVLGGTGVEDSDFWRGSASLFDTLFFAVESGTFRLFTDIAATLIEDVTGQFGGSSLPLGRNVFQVDVNSNVIVKRRHEYLNSLVTGQAELLYVEDTGSFGTGFIDLTFTQGKLDLNVHMYSEVLCGAQHGGSFANKIGTCLLGVDAFNSIRLIGGSVFDAAGNEVAGGFLGSESGFDYSVGVEPHGEPSAVPLPAGLPLLAAAVSVLLFWRRRS